MGGYISLHWSKTNSSSSNENKWWGSLSLRRRNSPIRSLLASNRILLWVVWGVCTICSSICLRLSLQSPTLTRVTMVANMNARSLNGIIAVDVEDFGNAWCNALGRLLVNLAHYSGEGRHGTTNEEKLLNEAIKFNVIDVGGTMNTLEVVALRILALKVANAGGRAKNKAYVILNVGGLGFNLDMAVVTFVHAVHGFGLCLRGWNINGGGDKQLITIKTKRKEIHLHDLQSVII